MRSVKFGAVYPIYGEKRADWKAILEYAKASEAYGYDMLLVNDHFVNWTLFCDMKQWFTRKLVYKSEDAVDWTVKDAFSLDGWTTLTALAAATSTIRLGTYVLCNQFRHPSQLARMVSTLDFISGGRVDLGLGAGWLKKEFRMFGMDWAPLHARLERLRESIRIMKALWQGNNVSFSGKYYTLSEANLEPKPIQKPHPPIIVGGVIKEVRDIAAELGDGWIPEGLSAGEFSQGIEYIKAKAAESGRDPNKILAVWGGGDLYNIIDHNEAGVKTAVRSVSGESDIPLNSLHWIIGTPRQCVDKIESYVKAGATHVVIGFPDFPSTHSLELFAKSVIPSFR